MRDMRQFFKEPVAGCVLLSMLIFGCSSGTTYTYDGPTGEVTGKVTFKGSPVSVGQVNFQSTHGAASGEIEEDGTYTLTYLGRSGIPVGDFLVYVTPPRTESTEAQEEVPSTVSHPMIPEKYQMASTSGLKFSVKEGANTYDIAME
jgi:hypothetical protein